MVRRALTFVVMQFALQLFAGTMLHTAELSVEACQTIHAQYGITPEGCTHPERSTQNTAGLAPEVYESHVFFTKGGAALDDVALGQITLLAQVLDTTLLRDACLRLIGHSDTSGNTEANYQLAIKRAEAVQAELYKHMSDQARIVEIAAKGEAAPLPNVAGTSPWQRRVEIRARSCR